MSFDPFGQEPSPRPPIQPPDREYPTAGAAKSSAREQVVLPAILLITLSLLNLLAGLGAAGVGFMFSTIPPEKFEEQLNKQQPENLEQMKKAGYSIQDMLKIYTYGGYGSGAVWVFLALLTIIGGACMLMLRGYAMAVFSAVLMAVPCLSPMSCPCLIGMVIGIWSLTVLLSEEVRAGFR
jgi:hypothetical protein